MMNKKELRKEILALRNALLHQERCEKSNQIVEKVYDLDSFKKSNKLLLYQPMKSEVDITKIFEQAQGCGKDIYVPRVIGEEMEFYLVDETTEFELSAYGIREPKPETTKMFVPSPKDHIFVLMPGVAFDTEGNRIGYGGGYYDKYLQRLADGNLHEDICTVAVAYDCQIVELGRIETESHDRKVDYIVTETKDIRRED